MFEADLVVTLDMVCYGRLWTACHVYLTYTDRLTQLPMHRFGQTEIELYHEMQPKATPKNVPCDWLQLM